MHLLFVRISLNFPIHNCIIRRRKAMTDAELITALTQYQTPITLVLFIYLFFKINKLENWMNKLDGKLCMILTILNGKDPKKKE
jgi:hypothetical protein